MTDGFLCDGIFVFCIQYRVKNIREIIRIVFFVMFAMIRIDSVIGVIYVMNASI